MTTLIPVGTAPASTTTAPAAGSSATTASPTPAVQTQTAPDAQALLVKASERAAKLEKELTLKQREAIVERRKWEGEKKGLSEKLKDAEFGARIKKEGQVNRGAIAKEIWGDKWYEALTEAQLSGGAPTAESVALELEKRDKAWEEKLNAKDKAAEENALKARAAQTQQGLQRFQGSVAAGLKANAEKVPALLERHGSEAAAAEAIVARIRKHHDETFDPETRKGEVLQWGKVALELEAEERAIAERIGKRLTPAQNSGGNPQPKVQQPQGSSLQQVSRKTLSNDLTASTQGSRPAPRNDEERAKRMRDAYEAALASRTTT